ncbi:MAG: valine--tRNA ligase [Lentisphaeria bacterium]
MSNDTTPSAATTPAAAYSPAEVEARWYAEWEQAGCFRGRAGSGRQPYTIVIPPPNVTGVLTMGHVLNNTLQDILIRFEKMRGRETCWLPGTDHAGIATQSKVEHMLKEKENLSRYDLGREKFLERVWEWKQKYGGTIIRQLRRLGSSCDWERERFTLDAGLSAAVQEVFIRLYRKGLIYKGHRIINWCPKSRTALSDEEVIFKEQNGKLWHFKYPFKDGSGHVTVATTRPETLLGDTAVAVNPKDERYTGLLGKILLLPLVGREIPLIADDYVDPAFGTGAVKITPAHDPNDYEMGLRHQLPMINVMNDDASMNAQAGADFAGLDRYACRKAVVAKMEELGLLDKIEDHKNQVGYSERGDVPVEPRLSEQWFVRMQPLAEPALQAVVDGRIHFHPDRWVKTYRHWMENIKDWCISRQLWWGHRIPAYYCESCGEIVVDHAAPAACPKCGGQAFRQDADVLDTWFSSWLWPFSVFGWPQDNPDLKAFYPTNTLVTGPDIIFFWVARMIMSGLEFMGEVPFRDVYFTSIIRDDKGRKLSKSLNNSPDPLDVIATYGADALRFTIIYIAPVGQDIRYANEKCEIGRNFATKLWNVARFRQRFGTLSPEWRTLDGLDAAALRPDDAWILRRADDTVRGLTGALDRFDFHEYTHTLYEFVWSEFCDWYLESAKAVFNGGDEAAKAAVLRVFDHVLSQVLRLLHPVMPFLTEELWRQIGFGAPGEFLVNTAWPAPDATGALDRLGATADTAARVREKFELVSAIRNVKANYKLSLTTRVKVVLVPADAARGDFLRRDLASLQALAFAESAELCDRFDTAGAGPCAAAVGAAGTAYVPLAGLIDVAAETARLEKQAAELHKFISGIEGKLGNPGFVSRAPEAVVAGERTKLADAQEQLRRVTLQLRSFK